MKASSEGGLLPVDGWTAKEAQTIGRYMPVLFEELYQLWRDTTLQAPHLMEQIRDDPTNTLAYSLIDFIWRWRTTGMPKGSAFETRALSVASTLTRAWHKALNAELPEPPASQWSGRKQTSVTTATCHWLATPKAAGSEHDLSKAYDTINPWIAYLALLRRGVARAAAAMLYIAWNAIRVCAVNGHYAKPLRPKRSIPQGDPCAGNALSSVLDPWDNYLTHAAPTALKWAYVDDRTLAVTPGPNAASRLQTAIEATARFDRDTGLLENAGKRQLWHTPADSVEHLGLVAHPADPSACYTSWRLDQSHRYHYTPHPSSWHHGR